MPNTVMTSYTLGQEFPGLGHVEILAGSATPQPVKGELIKVGEGHLTGCTENNGGADAVPVVIYLDKVNEYGILGRLFSGLSMDKMMMDVTKFISKKEAMLKAYYGASKIDINYSWRQ